MFVDMSYSDRSHAEAVLRHVLEGRHICGVTFYGGQQWLLIDYQDRPAPDEGASLFLETTWELFASKPSTFPSCEEEFKEKSLSKLCETAALLNPHRITSATLGSNAPHLIIEFDNGSIFFVNGHHEMYETWHLTWGEFEVIACPGANVSVAVPTDFGVA